MINFHRTILSYCVRLSHVQQNGSQETRNSENDDSQAPRIESTIPAEKGYFHLATHETTSVIRPFGPHTSGIIVVLL